MAFGPCANMVEHFQDQISLSPFILIEGSIIERIRRSAPHLLDPWLINAPLVYDNSGREILANLHRQYINISLRHNLPVLIFSDTWRANSERLKDSSLSKKDVNADCVHFLRTTIQEYGEYSSKILLGGLMGCRGDAYDPKGALSERDAESFHEYQAFSLAAAKVDFLFAATIPSLSEAAGMAAAMSRTGVPYVISFVLNRSGLILDGTSLQRAIGDIDASTSPAPLFYMANCCHPTFYRAALTQLARERSTMLHRLIGLQANTSAKDAGELNDLPYLDSEEPVFFAESMIGLHKEFGTRILGGCCGTDDRHIAAIASAYNRLVKRRD